MVVDLWLPAGVTHEAPSLAGRNVSTGARVVVHTFRFHSDRYGKTRVVKIPADESMSLAQVEDMAASALESWHMELEEQAQRKMGKHPPSPEERKEVGKAIREFREYTRRRRESTNQRLYYTLPKMEA